MTEYLTEGRALSELGSGRRYRLGELLERPIPKTTGLYALWHENELLYVGISYRDPVETNNPRAAGVQGRLQTYLDAWLTTDFVLSVALRFVISGFDSNQMAGLANGTLKMTDVRQMVKPWLWQHIQFSTASAHGPTARTAETIARRNGIPPAGPPAFNALPNR